MCSNISNVYSRVAGTVEDILGLAHGINLASASHFAHVVILEEEIAVGVDSSKVLVGLHDFNVLVGSAHLAMHNEKNRAPH